MRIFLKIIQYKFFENSIDSLIKIIDWFRSKLQFFLIEFGQIRVSTFYYEQKKYAYDCWLLVIMSINI